MDHTGTGEVAMTANESSDAFGDAGSGAGASSSSSSSSGSGSGSELTQLVSSLNQAARQLLEASAHNVPLVSDQSLTDLLDSVWSTCEALEVTRTQMTGEWDARGCFRSDGSRSAAARLARDHQCSQRAASLIVRRARFLRRFRLANQAFANGEVTTNKVDVLARVATPVRRGLFAESEDELVEDAKHLACDDLTKVAAYWGDLADEHIGQDRSKGQHQGRRLALSRTAGGSVSLDGLLDPVSGTVVLDEVERIAQLLFTEDWAAARQQFGDGATVDQLARSATQRRADALVIMATRSANFDLDSTPGYQSDSPLGFARHADDDRPPGVDNASSGGPGGNDHGPGPNGPKVPNGPDAPGNSDGANSGCGPGGFRRPGGSGGSDGLNGSGHGGRSPTDSATTTSRSARPLFSVEVDKDTAMRICQMADGTVVHPNLLVSWFTQADFERVVFDTPSRVIEVGSRARFFRGGLRRAIELRDKHCTYPGCRVPAADCDIDHIVEYSAGGETSQANGRLRCPAHNRQRPGRRQTNSQTGDDDSHEDH